MEFRTQTQQLLCRVMSDMLAQKPLNKEDFVIDWMRKEKMGQNQKETRQIQKISFEEADALLEKIKNSLMNTKQVINS